ncbi:MAG: hypothetical protein AB2A00_24440 [Myxococcota bacterium]
MDLMQNFLEVLANVIRTSPLAGRADITTVQAAVSSSWAQAFKDGTLDLRPTFNALISCARVELMDAARACLFLKSRERRLGLTLRLPSVVESLAHDVRVALLEQVSRQGVHSGVTNPGV